MRRLGSPSAEGYSGFCLPPIPARPGDRLTKGMPKVYYRGIMTLDEYYIVYPEGECQELEAPLRIDELVDLNGRPHPLPLANPRVIAFRVVKMRQTEERGTRSSFFYVELVSARELLSYCY